MKFTLKSAKKEFTIYKSHPLKNGFISITYARVLGNNTVSTEDTVEIEKTGSPYKSLWDYYN